MCAWACTSDAQCDKGFACVDAGTPSHKVCFPAYGSNSFLATCAGSQKIGQINCDPNNPNPCGTTAAKNPPDIECYSITIQGYTVSACTVDCATDNDCPGKNVCRKFGLIAKCSPY